MNESREIRLKRLRLRSWRRGIKEMDLILGGYADAALSSLTQQELDAYEHLIAANDQDIYLWFKKPQLCPPNLLIPLQKIKFNFNRLLLFSSQNYPYNFTEVKNA